MKFLKSTCAMTLLLFMLAAITACSGSKSPMTPSENSPNIPVALGEQSENGRSVIAVYNAEIDPIAKTFTISPDTRSSMFHFPVSQYYPVLSITGYGWTPNFYAYIRLKHPYPGSGITGYDPRVIAILPANAGVSMNYPVMDVVANIKVVLTPDGYTKLFDNYGGSTAGNANPFKAYFKSQPYRAWESTGMPTETQRWDMNLAGFGGTLKYKLVVDVSTNYPQPSTPIVDNAKEPVEMSNSVGDGLTQFGGSAVVSTTLTCWQGWDRLYALVEAPALFDGFVTLYYAGSGPMANQYIFLASITNSKQAPKGTYPILIGAFNQDTGVYMYSETTATVAKTLNPEVIKTLQLDTSGDSHYSSDIKIQDKYAYISTIGRHSGSPSAVYAVDIFPPQETHVMSSFPTSDYGVDIYGVDADSNYVYAAGYGGMMIFNTAPENLMLRGSVYIPDSSPNVRAEGNYAYVTTVKCGLKVINIESPDTAHVVGVFMTSCYGVDEVENYYIYTCANTNLDILQAHGDADPIFLKSVDIDVGRQVRISGQYAYVASTLWGSMEFQVVKIMPVAEAAVVKKVPLPDYSMDVAILGNYAYVACYDATLQIVDISSPNDSHVEMQVALPGIPHGIDVKGDYAFVSSEDANDLIIVKLF